MKLVQKDSFKAVGIKVVANWDNLWIEMPRVWKEFVLRYAEIKNRIDDTFIDISLQKEGDEFIQLVCAEVLVIEDVPQGMVGLEIPSQRYIYFRHVGPVAQITTSFGKMHEWADKNGQAVDDFKLDRGYTKEGLEQEHDLFIRIVPGSLDTSN